VLLIAVRLLIAVHLEVADALGVLYAPITSATSRTTANSGNHVHRNAMVDTMVSTTVGTMVRVAGQVPRVRRVEADVQRILRGQDGVITRAQALEAGLSSDGLKARVRSGQWARPLRGVYVVGAMAMRIERCAVSAIPPTT
jgi:tetrahydromethanopterin S-methyltransferase subunit F